MTAGIRTGGRGGWADEGQSLVEFSLVLVPLALLLLGAVQFGVIWGTQIGVTNATRDAARAASLVQPKADVSGAIDSLSEQAFAAGIRSNLLLPALQKNVAFYGASSLQASQVCYETIRNATNTADILTVTVTVTYAHPIFVPLVASVLGKNSAAATATVAVPVGLDTPYTIPPVATKGCSP